MWLGTKYKIMYWGLVVLVHPYQVTFVYSVFTDFMVKQRSDGGRYSQEPLKGKYWEKKYMSTLDMQTDIQNIPLSWTSFRHSPSVCWVSAESWFLFCQRISLMRKRDRRPTIRDGSTAALCPFREHREPGKPITDGRHDVPNWHHVMAKYIFISPAQLLGADGALKQLLSLLRSVFHTDAKACCIIQGHQPPRACCCGMWHKHFLLPEFLSLHSHCSLFVFWSICWACGIGGGGNSFIFQLDHPF